MKLGKAELAELIALLAQADEYLDLGEGMVKGAKPTVVRALKLVLNTALDVGDDLGPELARLSAMTAKNKRRAYTDYAAAGFTAEQAFSLVLASVKPVNFTEMLNKSNVLSREKSVSKTAK
ncbi:MAG: hypothetical protein Q8P76_00725 [bacterium]|nr:hypothetical protein [bacterium]